MEYGELDAVSPDDKWRHDVEDYAVTLRAMANFIESCPEIARDKALWEVCADVLKVMDEFDDLDSELAHEALYGDDDEDE